MHLRFKKAVWDVSQIDCSRLGRRSHNCCFCRFFGQLFLSVREFRRYRRERESGCRVDIRVRFEAFDLVVLGISFVSGKGAQTSSSSVDKSCSPAKSLRAFSSSNSLSKSGSDSSFATSSGAAVTVPWESPFVVFLGRSESGRIFVSIDFLCWAFAAPSSYLAFTEWQVPVVFIFASWRKISTDRAEVSFHAPLIYGAALIMHQLSWIRLFMVVNSLKLNKSAFTAHWV